MIKSNLAVLLAERGMRISKVAEQTGISRTTLTALSYNHCVGVQFDTINALCHCLGVSPGDLISFFPADFKLSECHAWLDDDAADRGAGEIAIDFTGAQGKLHAALFFEFEYTATAGTLEAANVKVEFADDFHNEPAAAFVRTIPALFVQSIKANISDTIEEEIILLFQPFQEGDEVYGGVSPDCDIDFSFSAEF